MTFFGIILGVAIMVGMIGLALDKKSNLAVRIASLIAIALMILTLIICLFMILTDNRVPVDESIVIVGAVPETKERSTTNVMVLLLLIIFLVALFAIIAFLSLREHHKLVSKTG